MKRIICAVSAASLLFVSVTIAVAAAAAPAAAPQPTSDERELAVRFAEFAKGVLQRQTIAEPQWRRCATLLAAARRLDPTEPRYARLHADALIQLRDSRGALEALNALRAIKPDDRTAQVEVIELHVAAMQTVDQKVEYLKRLVGVEAVPREVRAAAAFRCAALLAEKKAADESAQMIDRTLELNPLHFQAIGVKMESLPAGSPERFALLVGAVRSNPGHPAVLHGVARQLAVAGLPGHAADWYMLAVGTAYRSGQSPQLEMLIEWIAEEILADRLDPAAAKLDQMIKLNPSDYASLVLRGLIERRRGKPDEALMTQARNALVNRIQFTRNKLGVAAATTRPVDEGALGLPDLAGDAALFRKAEAGDDRELKQYAAFYLQSVAELAWFLVFHANQPAEAERYAKHFDNVIPENDQAAAAMAARLHGWVFLQQNRFQEARVKLSAVAERDPLAALGLARATAREGAAAEKAKAEAQAALARQPYGFDGVLLAEATRDLGARVEPAAGSAPFVNILNSIPQNWLRILDAPQQFYAIRGEPTKVSYALGEPVMLRVTIQNISNQDLTIGPDGVIKTGLWFDAELKGLHAQFMPGVCYERITEQFILKPKQGITMLVRIDQGELSGLLAQRWSAPIGMKVSVCSNPLLMQEGGRAVPGPCGFVAEVQRLLDRAASPANEAAVEAARKGALDRESKDRLRQIYALAAIGNVLVTQGTQQQNDKVRQAGEQLFDVLKEVRDAAAPPESSAASAWAGLVHALHVREAERAPAVQRMVSGQSSWQAKLLGLSAMTYAGLPPDRQKAMANELRNDSEPLVRQFADATLAELNQPPATRPAQGRPAPQPRP